MDTHQCDSLHDAARNGHDACVRAFIDAGADLNAVDEYGFTPLHWVAWTDHDAVVLGLLAAGADPNIAANNGSAPLHAAAGNGRDECVLGLLAAGADPNVVTKCGRTPLQLAVENGREGCANIVAVRVLADRALADDEWILIPGDSDIGYLLPVVMARDGRDEAAKLVSRLSEGKRRVLETVVMCLSHFVSRDVAEKITVRCT